MKNIYAISVTPMNPWTKNGNNAIPTDEQLEWSSK